MSLQMRSGCQGCGAVLDEEGLAFICSYECTFCEGCAGGMGNVCPNCGGELVRRPRRRSEDLERSG